MKRSEINDIIDYTVEAAGKLAFPLPPFAFYNRERWEMLPADERELIDNMLGWDITDFGCGDFSKIGLTIFTFRNGNFHDKITYPKPYCEKLLFVRDGQILPFHFHWQKIEDIINRGGGDLRLKLFNADEKEDFADTDVLVSIDGRKMKVPAGGEVVLHPGQSITLKPYQYHQWQGVPGTGDIALFEVSSTNDDRVDNRFHEAGSRLPEIEEDVPAKYLLFKDYERYASIRQS
ncbi:D-lyxose/D-mannose family sugar isomerase [Selenomonas sputigena]|uniref:D-lyxose ketol-isomerase n=1 Tax=Selenomonas sputigena TaxID=69823 RepID=A0ABV3X937_9FIRM